MDQNKLLYPDIFTPEFIASAPPMMQQYLKIKEQHLDKLVLFRMGDFYEFFYDDALLVGRILNIAVSKRSKNKDEPMAGFPYHSRDTYLIKLLDAGYCCVVCEQIADPNTKGLVERKIVQILTPGTLIDENLLTQEARPLVAVIKSLFSYSLVVLDLGSGSFEFGDYNNQGEFLARLEQLKPAEIIYSQQDSIVNILSHLVNTELTALGPQFFAQSAGARKVKEFNLIDQQTFANYAMNYNFENAYIAINALFEYVKYTQGSYPKHLKQLQPIRADHTMILDQIVISNLELLQNNTGVKKNSLLAAIDNCVTAMGSRQLQQDILRPLLNLDLINSRLDLVESLLSNISHSKLANLLKELADLERIAARIGLSIATPTDLTNLRNGMQLITDVNNIILNYGVSYRLLEVPQQLINLLENYLVEFPAKKIGEGMIFNSGISEELDQLYHLTYNTQDYINQLENQERQDSGIINLKIESNNLSGYFIQVPLNSKVPDYYQFIKSLKNANRYTTPELLNLEQNLQDSQFKINRIENQLFNNLLDELQESISLIQELSHHLSRLDVGQSHAVQAFNYNYCRPQFNQGQAIKIIEGRHPVIEQILNHNFTANDTLLDYQQTEQNLMLITGPNMGGKSTYMRQTGLICLLAQAGGYVPATSAELPIFERIFTRVGANDDLAQGRSTFMVEMNELASILNQANSRSLLIIDEIGRGTSTYDGLSLAWASLEYIANQINCYTLCATHYFELTQLNLNRLVNYHLDVSNYNDKISFSHRLLPNAAEKSYGIAVAKLAGVPDQVIKLAQQHLQFLEAQHEKLDLELYQQQHQALMEQLVSSSQEAPDPLQQEVLDALLGLDLDNITPHQALQLLYQLHHKLTNS